MYTNHFVNAINDFFREIDLPIHPTGAAHPNAYELTGSLGITGAIHGYFLLQSELQTAKNLVSGMAQKLGVTFDELEFGPFHRATIGEITNQIAGKAIAELENQGINCNITPPTIFLGQGISISIPSPLHTWEQILEGEFGTIRFFIALSNTQNS